VLGAGASRCFRDPMTWLSWKATDPALFTAATELSFSRLNSGRKHTTVDPPESTDSARSCSLLSTAGRSGPFVRDELAWPTTRFDQVEVDDG
jgi:hypothetical protein